MDQHLRASEPAAGENPDDFDVLVVTQDDGVVVATVRGEIDVGNAPRLWDALDEAIGPATSRLVIDLGETAFVDSAALSVFVRAFKRLRHQGAGLVLRSPRANARKVLNITGLDRVFTIEN